MPDALRTRTVTVGDIELAINEAGVDERPLILIHGFTAGRGDFDMVLERLAERGWHAVSPDLRGHGDSSQPTAESSYSFEIMAKDVLGLADALGFATFAILGHSMGGMVAQHVALLAPHRIDALIPMCTSHGPFADPASMAMAAVIARDYGIDGFATAVESAPGMTDTDASRRVVEEDPEHEVRRNALRRGCSAAMVAGMVTEMIDPPDRLGALSGLTAPTFVIVGEQDASFLDDSHRMANAIPGARLAVVAGAGHNPQFEAQDEWWSALSSFLDELAVERAGEVRRGPQP